MSPSFRIDADLLKSSNQMSGGKAGIGKGFLLVEHNRPDS